MSWAELAGASGMSRTGVRRRVRTTTGQRLWG